MMKRRSWLYLALFALFCAALALFSDGIYLGLRQLGPVMLVVAICGVGVGVLSVILRLAGARGAARIGLAVAALAIGAQCWMLGFTLAYELSGRWSAVLGAVLLGFGVVPVSVVAALSKGYFLSVGALGAFTLLFAAAVFAWAKTGPKPTA
jgi:hypothetical protein